MARERVSIFGHFSHLQGKDTLFITVTSSYLELREILKLAALSRKFKQAHQTTNSHLVTKLLSVRISTDRDTLHQLHFSKGDLESKVKRLEMRDEVRS